MLRVLLLAGVALALAGCASHPPVLATSGETYAVVDGPQTAGADALIGGELALDENSCWVIADDDGAMTNILWPDGTYLDGDDRIALPGNQSLGVGAQITMGGGEGPATTDQPPCWSRGDLVWEGWGAEEGTLDYR